MDTDHIRLSLPRWIEQLRRHLLHRLGCKRNAADLAQEAGARLLEALARGERFVEPRAWMFRVGHNLAVDEIRRRAPMPLGLEWQSLIVDPRTEEQEEEPVYMVGGREYGRSELQPLLARALAGLSAGDRALLLRRYVGGRRCMDLARADGVSEDAGKVRLHRARRRLAARIERVLREPPLRAACALALGACSPRAAGPDADAALATPVLAAPDGTSVESPAAAAAAPAPRADVDSLLARARALRAAAAGLRGIARIRQLEGAAAAYAAVSAQHPDAHPEVAEAEFRRGEILRGLERDADSRGAFLEALDAADAGGGEPWGVRSLLELGRASRQARRRVDAIGWFERAEAREHADLRHRNDAREALAELRLELALWEPAAAAAARWERDAESAAERSRAALLRARALCGMGRDAEADAVLAAAERELLALAPDASPEGAEARAALESLRAVAAR